MQLRLKLRGRLQRWLKSEVTALGEATEAAGDMIAEKLGLTLLVKKLVSSIKLIAGMYLISIPAGGLALSLADHRSFGDGLWWAFVTAPTIGYGDISPTTLAGRIVAVIFMDFWAYVITPLVVVNLLNRITHNPDQFTNAEQGWIIDAEAKNAETQQWLVDALLKLAQEHGVTLLPPPAASLRPRPRQTDNSQVTD